jgi:hypothetical protein
MNPKRMCLQGGGECGKNVTQRSVSKKDRVYFKYESGFVNFKQKFSSHKA